MPFASKLKHRFQIRKPDLTESSDRPGGLDQTYITLLTVWGSITPVSENSIIAAIRGTNTEEVATHIIKFRWIDIKTLGKAFSSGFSIGFKGMADINPLKTQYYLFKEEGYAVRGRLFKILGTRVDEDYKDFIYIKAREIEEQGTGYGEE